MIVAGSGDPRGLCSSGTESFTPQEDKLRQQLLGHLSASFVSAWEE